ncbi:MAG: thrombospondin type 3 repeat-containing protein [Patescibacteria group bacterium]
MPDNPQQGQTGSPAPSQRKARIHTMPDKFYIDDAGGGGSKNTFLIIGIIILVVAILGAATFFLLQRYGGGEDNANSATNATTNGVSNINTGNVNAATNSTVNTLANANAALNTNTSNGNVNAALNVNSITNNLFPNSNTATNTASNVNAIVSSRDSDSDSLTDIEEALFGTNLSLSDTDGDGYQDGQEVTSGYDPNGTSALDENSAVYRYTDGVGSYSILYPNAWDVATDPQSAYGKMFSSTNGEFIEVSIEENPAKLGARDWYLTKSPGIDSTQILSVSTWDGKLVGVKSPDGSTVYYTKGDNAYVISYNINILSEANFLTTFEMMYQSFVVIESALTNTNTNTSNTNSNTNVNVNSNGNSNTNTNTNSNTNSTPHL